MKIGIFSGSFNPIHVGHLILANYITEFTDLDEIWLLVTPQNPLKQNGDLLSEDKRLEMARIAVKDFPKIIVSDFEFSLPRPSYTINTLQALKEKHPEHSFSLIIGGDNWASFNKWFEYKRIIDEFQLYVYPRLNYKIHIPSSLSKKVEIFDSPIIEISSTFIRDSIKLGKNTQAFVPSEVYKYIVENKLYTE